MELAGLLTLIIIGVVLAVAVYIGDAILSGINAPAWGHKVMYGIAFLIFVIIAARTLFGINVGI